MAEPNASFVGSIPAAYHQYLRPLFFEPYAADLASRCAVPAGAAGVRVLELAAGTGILTRHLRARLPPGSTLVATDLSEGMIEIGKGHVHGPGLTWQPADATSLPFPDATFDVVACQFGVMFFPDKDASAREASRVLAPGGQFLFNVWGSLDENPLARIAHVTAGRLFGSNPSQFYHLPFGYHETHTIRTLLERAGFGGVEVHTVDCLAQAPSARHAALGLISGSPVWAAIQARADLDGDAIVSGVATALADALGDTPLLAPMRAHVISGRKGG